MHTHREPEATVVREIASRVLSGESLNAITKDLNARGITTVSGKEWRAPNVRAMMLGPHLAGLRTHNGAIAGEAQWEAILTRETWEAVRAILTDPSRGTGQSNTRKYVLTGVGRCGVCNGKIRGRMAGKGKYRQPAYMCETTGHVHRAVKYVDEFISETVGEWLTNADTDGSLFTPDEGELSKALTAEADTLTARRKATAKRFAMGEIDEAFSAEVLATIDARLREISEAHRDVARLPAVLDGLVGEPDARQLFDRLPLDRQRAVLEAMPGTVVLFPGKRGGAGSGADRFDPETVDVVWDDA